MARHDGTAEHALLTDQPGVLVAHPRQQLVKILILYALLPLVCGTAGAVVAYQLSNVVTDRRVAALEDDLAQRRAANAAANEARDAQLGQTRRDLCVVIDRVQPRDQAVQDIRKRYGCTGAPAAIPTPVQSATPSPAVDGRRSGASGARPPATERPTPRPGPSGPPGPPGKPGPTAPATPPSPPPAPVPPGDGLICLPVLGCVL